MLVLVVAVAHAEPVWVGRFDAAVATPPPPWRVVHFDKRVPATHYRTRLWDGIAAVEAEADAAMALLARPLEIDVTRTPVLCWRWRIDAPLRHADMVSVISHFDGPMIEFGDGRPSHHGR